MDEITHLVLAETTAAIDRINETFGAASTISLNVAAKQADEPLFMRSLLDAIDSTGFAPPLHARADRGSFSGEKPLPDAGPSDDPRGRRARLDR